MNEKKKLKSGAKFDFQLFDDTERLPSRSRIE